MTDLASGAASLPTDAPRAAETDLSATADSRVKHLGKGEVREPVRYADLDDDALVEAARTERAAFGALYDRHVATIYHYVLRRTSDPSLAEDITSAVWEKALISIERYEVRGVPFTAWLYRIAGNLVANHHRRRQLLRFVPLGPEHARTTRPSDQQDARSAVRAALAALSESDREILTLCYFTGLTPPEIAAVLGCKVPAVHKRLHRARQRLARRLEEDSHVDPRP